MKTPRRSSKGSQSSGHASRGPVTLAQVKSMVKAAPSRKRAVPLKRGELAASPASVGLERKKLRLQRRRDDEIRVRQFKDMMVVMKKRGVQGLAPAVEAPTPRGTRASTKGAGSVLPLQILAEGDSWFDYPPFLFKGGIIPRLEERLGVPILNLAKAGDEVRYMLGVEERRVLIKHLGKGSPVGGAWDVLLFSGGGNDIVDNPMALWVRDFDASVPPQKLIHAARYDAALALVEAGYEDLIALRDALSPNTHLVFHGYDFAIPDGRGICHLGPWLKPTFDLRQFLAKSNARFEVVKVMLQQFAALLQTLEKNHRNVTLINGQGTLAPQAKSWHNELHPSRDGFDRFADLFQQKLKALFPGRVL